MISPSGYETSGYEAQVTGRVVAKSLRDPPKVHEAPLTGPVTGQVATKWQQGTRLSANGFRMAA